MSDKFNKVISQLLFKAQDCAFQDSNGEWVDVRPDLLLALIASATALAEIAPNSKLTKAIEACADE